MYGPRPSHDRKNSTTQRQNRRVIKAGVFCALLLCIHAGSHPIEIEAESDGSSNYGKSYTLEDSLTPAVPGNCAKNFFVYGYFDIYR